MLLDIYPHQAFYHPGETVQFNVRVTARAAADVHIVASIAFLCDEVARLTQAVRLVGGATITAELTWMPPVVTPRGYGVDLQVLDGTDRVLATASTAFDILERWAQSPRYGFLTDFGPGRADFDQTMLWLTRYHVNGLQFYDWMYRHEQLLPPTEVFTDPLGRRLSLATVEKLIRAAHAWGIAAMPYTAVYAASVPFFQQHPNWALLDAKAQPIHFGDDFLMIMNPAPGSPWTKHLLSQFVDVLEKTAFDGIHLDQYGDPKLGFDTQDNQIDLANALPAFTDATKEIVQCHRGEDGTVIFNAVGNWPIETVAPSEEDVVYVEVWPPHILYSDLHQLVVAGQRLGGGKPVVLAVYIAPDRARNVRLADAVIFASGGYHIELGETGQMLADPYFPKYGPMSGELAQVMQRYYDFAVRYENILALDTHDATPTFEGKVIVEGLSTDAERAYNKIWPIVREKEGVIGLNLINMLELASPEWNGMLLADPPAQKDLAVRFYTERPVTRVWWATPDDENLAGKALEFSTRKDQGGTYIAFRVPSLAYWDLIGLE